MKLKDVKHEEIFCGKKTVEDFNFYSNRFYLFDKYGRELNSFSMRNVKDVLEINVIEIKKSGYCGYGVGFPTTHIKLDFLDDNKLSFGNFRFGDCDTRP